jgi:sugar lactone lactonase YvrE
LLLVAVGLEAAQTDNHGIHAVPTPAPVVVDGDLAEWDLSGSVLMCYDIESLKEVYSARVAMMHDADHLYVAIRWKDPVPMGNSHDPQFQADKGWAGDSVQLRVKTDRISHLTAWYYAAEQEPFIDIAYGKSLSEPFGGGNKALIRSQGWKLSDGAEMGFKVDADGKGYVQEIKLPWKLITLSGGRPDGRFACGVELLWGEADWPIHRYADNLVEGQTSREFFWTAKDAWGPVFLEKKGQLTLPIPAWEVVAAEEQPEGPIKITYTLATDQRVTLAIDDARGRRVRNLLPAAERKAGFHTELWDGLDDQGQVIPPGSYTVKGLSHDGLHLTYEDSFASPGHPPWNTADGRGAYYGDHTPPEAVAFGPGDRGAIACAMGEAGPHLIGVDLEGRRQWGLANRGAFGGGKVSLATDGKLLWIANVDGRDGSFTVWRCHLATGIYAPWKRTDTTGKEVLDLSISEKDGFAQARAIAVHQGRLAVILAAERRVVLLDAETGDQVGALNDLPAGLAALAFRADGTLLLAAGDELLWADPSGGMPKVWARGLEDPQSLAIDAQGHVYVSQRGQAMNVVVFGADGELLCTVGKTGGRPPTGFFNEQGMLLPSQIAIDAKGRLWVTESHGQPKRTSVWAEDGTLAFDLIGTTAYSAGGAMDPADRNHAISEETEYHFDEQRQVWRPYFTLTDALGTGFNGWVSRYARVGGREYIQFRSTARDSAMVKILIRGSDGGWRHCAEFGNVGRGKTLDESYHKEWNQKFTGPLWKGLFGKAFCWLDRNDDGKADPEEIETVDGELGAYYWGQAMGEDLRVVIPARGQLLTMKPEGFSPGGTPLYSLAGATRVKPVCGISGSGMLMVGRDGRSYLNQSPLTAVDATGAVLWTYPSDYVSVHGSHNAPASRPGLLIGPSSFYGTAWVSEEIGEVFLLNGNLGQNFIFTEDGLWVQSLWKDCRGGFDVPAEATVGMPCDGMTAGGESFGGGFCKTEDGKYRVVGGSTAAIVFGLTGLDSLKRFSTTVQVSTVDVAAADHLRVRRAARMRTAKVCTVTAAVAAPNLEGDLSSWQMEQGGVEIAGGAGAVGMAKAMYDATNLYLAWQVKDGTPLMNGGQDDRLMFITGDGVDLMLRTRDAQDDQPVAGDLRLLLTVKAGKPLAVLYQPVAAGGTQEEAAELSSPTRSVHFDRVRVIDIPLAMKLIPGGYAVTAALPLKLIGVETLKGRVLSGDFGILLSDRTGQECTSRNYWSNKAANNTSDVPDEAMLQPVLWSELRFL